MRFKRRSVAWSLTACSGVFLVVGLSGLITEPAGNGSFLFAAGLTVVSAVLVVRTFRMATIIVTGDTLVIRGFLRSRRIPIETIRTVEAIEERNMYGMAGRTLAILTRDGGQVVAGEFWSRVNRSGRAPRLDAIVRELRKLPRSPDALGPQGLTEGRAALSRHDRIVYLFALGSGALVVAVYFLSWKSVPWAWPAFVAAYLILSGAFLWWRRARN